MPPIAKRRRTGTDGAEKNEPEPKFSAERAAAASAVVESRPQPKSAPNPQKQQMTAQAVGEMYGYKSNVFRMETEEMLHEVALNYGSKRMSAIEKILHQLKSAIIAIPERKGLKISAVEAEVKKRKIYIPFPEPRPTQSIQYDFSYAKPSYINIAGSYALKTLVKQKEGISVDLVLTMPPEIFQEKDYLNYRYFYKRAYYLSVLASGLTGSKDLDGLKIEYDYLNGNQLSPILVVTQKETDTKSPQCTINIIPSVAPNVFPPSKLHPLKNCVRPPQQQQSAVDPSKKLTFDPTPFYNSSLAADTSYFPYLALLHSSATTCAAFTDACILGRVWLRQRGFGGAMNKGGFGHFEWAITMALLLKGGGAKGHALLTSGYSNYQMFKAMIQFLASRDLTTSPLVLGTAESAKISGAAYPVIFDGEHGVNVLFKMTPWSYDLLRHEAERTLECLNNSTLSDQFDSIFLYRVDVPSYRFDAVARLPFPLDASQITVAPEDRSRESKYARGIYSALKYGLNDRVALVHLSYSGTKPFAVKGAPTPERQGAGILVGLLVDGKNIARMMDRGPSPEEKKKAAAFRKFWGPKAELRRFADGSIIESVTWTKSKTPIYQQIIRHIVSYQFGETQAENISFIGDVFGHLIGGEQASAVFNPVFEAFDRLEKDLKALTGIPLAMRHVAAAAPALRASTIDLPFAPGQPLMEPADVVVQFESSGRWPDDLVAIQRTKASFLIKLGQLLEEAHDGQIITRVGLENEDNKIMNYAFLDVLYLSGPAFRIRIYHDREISLLENKSRDPTLPVREKEAALNAWVAHQRMFVLGPRHTDSIRRLCNQYPLMSPTIRLVKKWFAAQLFSARHVADELVELMVARVFLYPFPFAAPSSVMSGFLRSLAFLAKWDWRTQPLILDLSGDHMKADDFAGIRANFDAMRDKDPVMNRVAMFVASNHDRAHSLWTEGNRPPKVVAARMTALTRAADAAAKKKAGGLELEVHELFAVATGDFDFVLHLNPKYATPPAKKAEKYKNLQLEQEERGITAEDIARLSFDPCSDFVDEISNLYKNSLIFFHAPGQPIVGAAWIPINARKWKPGLGYSTVPAAGGTKQDLDVSVNKPAILNEISRIGGVLISKVVVNRP